MKGFSQQKDENESLKKEIVILKKDLAKFIKREKKINLLLGKQRSVLINSVLVMKAKRILSFVKVSLKTYPNPHPGYV